MAQIGLTKARSLGAIAEAIEQSGGSTTRVFAKAELPIDLLQEPDKLLLLRDQVRLLAFAVEEIGDPALPAKLSSNIGALGLGPLGRRVCAAATLGEAIACAEAETPRLLQTATWTGLAKVDRGSALYGYQITESIDIGRQINEVLALGYLLDVVRYFMGPGWRPERAIVTGATLPARSEIEAALDCEVAFGGPTAGLILPADCLKTVNPTPYRLIEDPDARPMPIYGDFAACVEHLLLLGMHAERPSIARVSGRLGMSRRSLQRRLTEERVTFAEIQQRVLLGKAKEMLAGSDLSINQMAFELGYSDPAHFSRAFQNWVGVPPSTWRRARKDPDPARSQCGFRLHDSSRTSSRNMCSETSDNST